MQARRPARRARPMRCGTAGRSPLSGARGEFVAFNLLVETTGGPVKQITVAGPGVFARSAGARLDGCSRHFPGLVRARWRVVSEICVPIKGAFDIPSADNAVPGQRCQSVYIEVLVPKGIVPGKYAGSVAVTAAGGPPVTVPVELTVNSLTLPDRLSFDISLNGYGTVGGPFGLDDRTEAYRALEREYHRMAHAHRETLVLLGYSHSGTVTSNYAPPLEGAGAGLRVRDWSAWDTQFGPYLDGSAFKDLPRKGVPVSHFYLPFHEAWPVDIRSHYAYKPPLRNTRPLSPSTR